AALAARGGTWQWPPASRRSAAITIVARVTLGIFRIGRGLIAARIGPGIQIGHGVHDAPAELAKRRSAADHALLLQRARRQPQVVSGLVVGEIALGLRGRSSGSGGRP